MSIASATWPPASSAYAPRVPAAEHPLRSRDGTAYPHRLVLYAKIGPGSQRCTWCGRALTWRAPSIRLDIATVIDARGKYADIDATARLRGAELVTDHVNGSARSNGRKNLVAACRGCNEARARAGNPRWFRSETPKRAYAQVGRLLEKQKERSMHVLRSSTDTSPVPDTSTKNAPVPVPALIPALIPAPVTARPPPLPDDESCEAPLDIEKRERRYDQKLWNPEPEEERGVPSQLTS